LAQRTLAGRRHDQLTKSPDYGAVLVAITVAQFYLSGMLQRTLPAGFIAPCKMGLEGIVSKRKESAYRSGRSPDWLKMKNPSAAAVTREVEEDWGKKKWR
jgi:ATP-dependent DNA ligase